MSPTVLVLQVRDRGPARDQEKSCFGRVLQGRAEVRFADLVGRPMIPWEEVDRADVLMVGGAGAHTVTERYDFSEPLARLVRRWVRAERPFFGSCWGHHFLAWALGGTVITDHEAEEVGTFEIELTEAGERDPLLVGFPKRFNGQLGHHDRIDRLPDGFVELAFSERCRNQMLRLEGRPIYSTQFHPEMRGEDLRERLGVYADEYLGEDEVGPLETISPSPAADEILGRFLDSLA